MMGDGWQCRFAMRMMLLIRTCAVRGSKSRCRTVEGPLSGGMVSSLDSYKIAWISYRHRSQLKNPKTRLTFYFQEIILKLGVD